MSILNYTLIGLIVIIIKVKNVGWLLYLSMYIML